MLQAGPVGGSPLLRRAAVRQFLPVLARRSFRRAAFSDSGKHVALSVGAASHFVDDVAEAMGMIVPLL
jgi:hypothetical protein